MTAETPASLRIEETTVATVAGWRVTVGNIMRGRWRDAAGQEREGLTAEIGLYDEQKRPQGEPTVGEGAELAIAGRRWLVARIVVGAGGDNGHVELRPL